MAKAKVTMEVGNDGVAVITFVNPPVNALAIQSKLKFHRKGILICFSLFGSGILILSFDFVVVFAGLKEKWNEAAMRNDVKAIVLTGKAIDFLLCG